MAVSLIVVKQEEKCH